MTIDYKNVEFSAKDLENKVLSNDWDLEDFKVPDWTSDEPKYGYEKPMYKDGKGKVSDYFSKYYGCLEDENGFPIVDSYVFEPIEDENDVYVEDFTYEGGFVPTLGYFKMVDNGNLGDGHDAWALVQHESGRLFRIGGWYSSWDSGEWDSVVEVEAAHVTVLRYKPVGEPDDKAFDNPAVTVR